MTTNSIPETILGRDLDKRNLPDDQFTHRATPPGLIKGSEVARMASVHPSVVRGWVRAKKLSPVVLPSGGIRYRLTEVMRLLGLDRADGTA